MTTVVLLLCALLPILGTLPTTLGCWTAEYNSKRVISVTNVQIDQNNVCINQMSIWNVSVTIHQLYECINITDSTTILFESGEFALNGKIELHGVHDIALIGCPNKSKIICSPSEPTGLEVVGVRGLKIVDLVFQHCGAVNNGTTLNSTTNVYVTIQSSIYISYSTDVTIESVSIANSTGNAVTFIDTNGTVTIKYSQFKWSTLPESQRSISAGGSGVYVEFTCNHTATYNQYLFKSCTFIGNNVSGPYSTKNSRYIPHSNFNGLNRGGGLCIFIKGQATNNSILISDTKFQTNSAERGGGLYVGFLNSPQNNRVVVNNSDFYQNNGNLNSGGASVVYLFLKERPPEENKIIFHNCNFTANEAKYGGGITIHSSKSKHYMELNNDFEFYNCIWMYNKAQYGSAVDILPSSWDTLSYGLLPIPLFEDCQFKSNEVTHLLDDSQTYIKYTTGKGAFSASEFYVRFKGNIVFENNTCSAIYLTSSILKFSQGTSATFADNSGSEGGAMAVIGFSSLHVQENSTFLFKNNTATERGGAIFSYSIDKHDDVSVHSCFIQYTGNDTIPVEERNITFTFDDNKAGSHIQPMTMEALQPVGHSIFATSLEPCFYACSESEKSNFNLEISTAFSCIGNFTYEGSEYEISSDGKTFNLEENCTLPLKVIPGKEFELPISIEDDFQHTVRSVYHATIENEKNSCIQIDEAHSYLYDRRIKIFGEPNNKGKLKLFKKGFREFAIKFEIELVECPPGFVIHRETKRGFQLVLNKCICATETEFTYEGLVKCNYTLFRAYVRRHYWMGYDTNETERGLIASYCPISFCLHSKSGEILIPLPEHASKKELDDVICGPTRTGILCAKCRDGYSTYYHSAPRYICRKNHRCKLGMLYYILSELVPLTLLFLTVMIFNISFTSGAANGFIFFAQIISSLSITAEGFIRLQKRLDLLTRTFSFLYYFFNFDFFGIDGLSFCLWKGATTLDILAFKYVTVVYALVLVIITTVVMNACNCYRICSCLKLQSVKGSVIHGLSAFLIMCYTQCALVSFRILGATSLYSQGHKYNRTVVYRYGEIVYFSKDHLPYAMPAIFSLIVIIGLPTILLLVYPAHYKVLASLGLKESSKISRWVTITKMKPLFDSFQSCYRDKCRFYAGLYFTYRLIILGAKVFIRSNPVFYITVELMLVIMICIHALIQPYQKWWHNTLDILIFTDLAIINGLTLYHYIRESYTFTQESVSATLYIQIILIYLPMVYMVAHISIQLAKRLLFPRIRIYLQKRKANGSTEQQHPDDNEFPARLIYNDDTSDSDSSGELATEYQQFEEYKLNDLSAPA